MLLWPLTLLATLAGPESGEVSTHVQAAPALAPAPMFAPEPAWSGELSLVQEYRLRTAGAGSASTAGALGEPVATNPKTDQDLRLNLDGQGRGYHDHLQGQ
ncbi:MAG TPA: hypothetical protein VIM14_21360, partial [Polyangia bacterium]